MTIDILDIVTALMDSQGIQVLFLSPPYDNITQLDYGFRRRLYQDFDYSQTIEDIENACQPGILLTLEDDLFLYYTAFRFPQNVEEEYGHRYCLIGPVLFQPISNSAFLNLMQSKNIPPDLYPEVQEFFNQIPLISSYDRWDTQTITLCSRFFQEDVQFRLARATISASFHPGYSDYKVNPSPEIAMSVVEDRYQTEDEMLKAISVGNTERALIYHQKFRQFKILPRTSDSLRNKKNLMFTLNTLLRKAVQAGRVHPMHIDNLSSQLAIQIESCANEHQLDQLSTSMIRKYCLLVKNYSRKAYSSLVQTCMDYVDFHYASELSLDSLAKLCAVTNSYLSSLFKKEVNMTLTDYINLTRIRQSLILLNTTTLPIQEIAVQCGFSDSNYFARTFKKFQGQSPKGYRETVRR